MPPYLCPSRTTLANGLPCWTGALIALPSLDLTPLPDDKWEARIMVNGCWAIQELSSSSIYWLLRHWRDDPERVALELFKAELPKGTKWQAPKQDFGPEDII